MASFQHLTHIRIGTRGSNLAIAQTHEVIRDLCAVFPYLKPCIEIVKIETSGDHSQKENTVLAELGGKGLFVKELEEALIQGKIDCAIHSCKDIPSVLPDTCKIVAVLPRENPYDAFISYRYSSLSALPKNATIGTSSPRRVAQVKAYRPDINLIPYRGNVTTRLEKLKGQGVDGIILAVAGLKRLHMEEFITEVLKPEVMLPAVGQGIIAVEALSANHDIAALLSYVHHRKTGVCVEAERAFLQICEGDCYTPLAAHAVLEGGRIVLDAWAAVPDGSEVFRTRKIGEADQAVALGEEAARAVYDLGFRI